MAVIEAGTVCLTEIATAFSGKAQIVSEYKKPLDNLKEEWIQNPPMISAVSKNKECRVTYVLIGLDHNFGH